MSEADMQLIRDQVPGGFNLAVGEPFFLQTTYGHLYPKSFDGKITYPPLKGDSELVQRLETRFGGQKVVITNGAKQALYAAVYALKRQKAAQGGLPYLRLTHAAPYWPTYPTIAELSGLEFETRPNNWVGACPGDIRVLTSPNNPDGSQDWKTSIHWDIWDAAYADPIYGWDCMVPWHKISVWSGAKAYGPSGYRIGWLATADEELAQYASEYVEKTTSGVAYPSQDFLLHVLKAEDALSYEERHRLQFQARMSLLDTSTAFMALADPYFEHIKGYPGSKSGMFAWVRPYDGHKFKELLNKARVKAVSGRFFGVEDNWIRFSLGVSPETMDAAVEAIERAYGSP